MLSPPPSFLSFSCVAAVRVSTLPTIFGEKAKFDSDIGVTKGEVYWALGNIHLQLGQPPKAKSMFQRGLEEEPGNQRLKEALSSLS